ncbi:MAG: restriction endonuclease subunit S [Planctomycetota bacterium]
MAGDLRATPVRELLDQGKLVIGDGYRAKNEELSSAGLPFARAQNIDAGFKFEDSDCIPEASVHRVGNKVSQPGDVVFTSKGTVGRFAIVSVDTPKFVYSPQVCFWRSLDHDTIAPRWLYYWMQGAEFGIQYKGVAGQTDMADYVSLRDQRRMSISLPEAAVQRAIADILGTLDDKIELNRRMNETLEAIARAMFKSWFVDFDPVRAKASGEPHESICRRLRLTPDLLAIFPERFVDSELGEIPEGWKVGLLGECIEILDSKRVPLSSREREVRRGQYPYHGAASVMDYVDDFLFDGVHVLAGEDGSVLSSGGKPVLQYVWGKFWVNNHAHVLRGLPPVSHEQLLLQLGEVNIGPFVTGAVQAKLSQSNLRRIEVVHAPNQVCSAFGSQVGPLFDAIRSRTDESRTLAVARDALLTEIFSGGVRVPFQGAS